jgi:hypothetical protein
MISFWSREISSRGKAGKTGKTFFEDRRQIMAYNKEEKIYGGYHDYRAEGLGDVFKDRLSVEWPAMKGVEVSEEEYEAWCESEGLKS